MESKMDLFESVRVAMKGGYDNNNDLAVIAYDCSVVALKDDVAFPICSLGRNSGTPSVASSVHSYDAYLKNTTTDKFGDTEDDDVTRAFELMLDIVAETVGLFKMLRLELLVDGSKRFSRNFDSQSDRLSITEAVLLVLAYYSLVRGLMAAHKDACYYIDHAVDIAFLELVVQRVDLVSLNTSFKPWFELTFNEQVYFSGGVVEAPPPEDSADRFNAVLVVLAFAFTPVDPKFGFADHQLLLKKIFDMEKLWAMMMVVLFGLGEGSTVDRRQIDQLSAHMRGLTGVTSPSMKILYRVAVLQAYQIAAYCFHRSIVMIGSICAPMPSCVLSFDILRNKMFAFMSDDSVDQSDQVEFRKKIQFHIGYDAHCKLLLDSLKKKGSVLANASVEPRGQLKETDGGMDDGLFDTEESDVNETKNLRIHGRSKKSRSSAQASESLPVEPMTTLTLQGIILSLEGDVSTLQGAVTTLQGAVTTLHGIVSTLEGIMSFHFPGGILASGSTVDNRKQAPVSSVRSVVAKRQLSVHKDSSDTISTSKSKSRRITKAAVSKALTKKANAETKTQPKTSGKNSKASGKQVGTRVESQHEAKTDYVAPHPLVYFGAIVRSDDDGEDSRFSPVNDVQLDTEYGELFFTSSEQDDDVESQNDEDDF